MNQQDPLQYLPIERWSDLQEALRSDWPRCISGYNMLKTQRRWIQEGLDSCLKVYCPFGDVWSGMVGVNVKGPYYELVIHCPTDDTKNLEEALRNSKVIDWTKSMIGVPHAPPHIIDMLQRVTDYIGKDVSYRYNDTFVFDRESKSSFEYESLPQGITYRALSLYHADLVDSKWPLRYPGSKWYFEFLINAKSGYGLFNNDELVCWVFICDIGFINHLFTLEDHRRKGYAELLLKLLINNLIKEKTDAFAFVIKGNDPSFNLFKGVGFDIFGEVAFCYLQNPLNAISLPGTTKTVLK